VFSMVDAILAYLDWESVVILMVDTMFTLGMCGVSQFWLVCLVLNTSGMSTHLH
jgi:hypothetical protein